MTTQEPDVLNPNGSCLGVALLKCWDWIGERPPARDLVDAGSIKEAIELLSALRPPRLIVRQGAGILERMALRVNAWRFGLQPVNEQSITSGAVLCLRSMRQLYGLQRIGFHWVALQIRDGKASLSDDLWNDVVTSFPEARLTDSSLILNQIGPTLLV